MKERELLFLAIATLGDMDQDGELPMRLKQLLWDLQDWKKGLR